MEQSLRSDRRWIQDDDPEMDVDTSAQGRDDIPSRTERKLWDIDPEGIDQDDD